MKRCEICGYKLGEEYKETETICGACLTKD